MGQRVPPDDFQAARAAQLDHVIVDVDAGRADAPFAEQVEEFAAAAADIQHVARALEVRKVVRDAGADLILGTAKPVLERHVAVALVVGGQWRREQPAEPVRAARPGLRPASEAPPCRA